jgi:hypothetical protein
MPFLAVACGSTAPTTIMVTASGFTKDEGKMMKIAAVDVNAKMIKSQATATVTSGGASFKLDVDPNVMYRIDLFADMDGNGVCEFGVDDAVSVTVADIAEGKSASVSLTPAQAASQGCLSFGGGTLKITGSMLPASAMGKVFFAQLLKLGGTTPVKLGNPISGTVTGTNIDIEFPGGIITNVLYRVDFYVDDNPNNTKCDTTDDVYRVEPGALGSSNAGGELDGMVKDTDKNPAACATFQ